MENTWLSAHIFYNGHPHLLLNNLVSPLLERTGYSAFFIRYWENGPHIRLRMQVGIDELGRLKKLLTEHCNSFFAYYPALHRHDALQFIPYQPEVQRYGNLQSLPWAERQFVTSSVYVLQHLRNASSWDDSIALLHAIRLNMALLFALHEEPAFTLHCCRNFIKAWITRLFDPASDAKEQERRYTALMQSRFEVHAATLTSATARLWESMEQEKAEPALQTFIYQNREIAAQYRKLGFDANRYSGIIGSFMHMGHNRLGVSNLDEAYIMFFTLKCMERIYAHMGA
ncbi:thiopeptide-type bacteriocin biosynthesis protein [uncultured Chitinophaga sp.]|jgi:thiopeptide-type bacteriocin biosynthesis domain|uniref:thiopeptide-type bacteriocin biosynthesis protein n=1 Tax=uncultured Chitinophaga sp. TaxID=339340 RepID=UPI0026263A37|nr:thiopeptide-type bacteriocin biosynthesis protein [uncultured Chitinophaga sp.]